MARTNIYPPSVKPGIPILGKKPDGWIETTFGAVLKPVYRKAKLVADQEYQLVIAKRNRGGVVPRSILKGWEIKTPTQFYIRENDFLIARRQIIHGACGVVPADLDGAVVSNEYSALLVKDGLLLDYLKYFCHTTYFQQTCFQSSVGVDVEKMIFKIDHWFKWPVILPPIPEQRKIAEILSTWDEAIAASERLLASLRDRKKGLMQRLLTPPSAAGQAGQVRFAGFDGEWKERRLGDIVELIYGKSPKGIQVENGAYPIFGTGGIVGHSNEAIYSAESVIIGRKGSIDQPQLALTPFWAIDTTFYCVPKEKISMTWFYYLLALKGLAQHNEGSTIPSLSRTTLTRLKFHVPDFSEQEKIASVLRTIDDEIDLQQEWIALHQQQKKGLMQRLLTGQVRVKV